MIQINAQPSLNPISAGALRVEMFRASVQCALGTAFLWINEDRFSIITAWHNLTGTNFQTRQSISKNGSRPDNIKLYLLTDEIGKTLTIKLDLYDGLGKARFRTHHIYGNGVDIAVIDVGADAIPLKALCTNMREYFPNDMEFGVGTQGLIVGFPQGISICNTPIYKQCTVASEPSLVKSRHAERYFLVDSATRSGMSGAPVFMVSDGFYRSSVDNALTVDANPRTRLLGLYSGRLDASDLLGAQLGIVWPIELVNQVVELGIADDFELDG
jgi:hypothetical protein